MAQKTARILPPLEAISASLACALVPTLPLLYGGATAAAKLVAWWAILVAFGLSVLAGGRGLRARRLVAPVGGLALLACLALLQSIRLPAALVELLAPARVEIARSAAAVLEEALPATLALSLTPGITRSVALDLLVLAAAVVAGHLAFSTRSRRRWLVAAALAAGAAQVVIGAAPWLAAEVPRLRGTYANSDHLATLLEMSAALCFAVTVWAGVSRRFSHHPERRALWLVAVGFLLLALLAGLAFTGSRAALAALGVGLALEISLLYFKPGLRRPLVIATATIVLGMGFLFWIGSERAFGRLLGTSWYEVLSGGRPAVWLDAAPLVARFPWFGTGLGSFREAFALVESPAAVGTTWAKAHNQYFELLICGGTIGLAILLVGLAQLGRELRRRLEAGRRSEDKLFVVGTIGASLAAAVHEFFDFGLSLTANSVMLALLVGAALSVGARPARDYERGVATTRNGAPPSRTSSTATND